MRRIVLLVVIVMSAPVVRAQSAAEFVGTIGKDLVPGRLSSGMSLTTATDEQRTKLGTMAAASDVVFAGDVSVGEGKRPLFLIASGAESRAVVADLNGNGAFDANEKVALIPALVSETGVALAATLRFSTTAGSQFSAYPMRVGLRKDALNPPAPAASTAPASGAAPAPARWNLTTSYQSFAEGIVPIDGQSVKVRLIANAKDFKVDASKSYQFVDCNGDGTLDEDFTSWEMGYGRGTPVVFHIGEGNRYVSVKGLDPVAGTLTLASRTAADYERVELRMGATLPDVAFKTLDGTPKKLSDFRGKYLMIDFWGTWCGPCVGEIPFIKKAYEKYKSKGFEVLGMDNELPDVTADDFAKGLEKVKAFVEKEGVTWTQAQTESIKVWYDRRFQIVAWPTMILLDPNGKIISVDRTNKGEPGLRGERLEQTLAAIFKDK